MAEVGDARDNGKVGADKRKRGKRVEAVVAGSNRARNTKDVVRIHGCKTGSVWRYVTCYK